MGTSKTAKVKLGQRTRRAVREERIQDAASSIVFEKSKEIRGVLSIASPTLDAFIRLSTAAKTGDFSTESIKLGIERFSDNPSSQLIRALMHIAITTLPPTGMSMASDLVARAAAQTFLNIIQAEKISPSKLTLEHIEGRLSETDPSVIGTIFVEKVVGSIVGFSLDRAMGEYTGRDKPFKTREQSDRVEDQIRMATVQWVREHADDVFRKISDGPTNQAKLKRVLEELSDSIGVWRSR